MSKKASPPKAEYRFYKQPSQNFLAFAKMVERLLKLQHEYFFQSKICGSIKSNPTLQNALHESKVYEKCTDTCSVKALVLANQECDTTFINFVEDYQQLRSRQVLYFQMKRSPGTYTKLERDKVLGECMGRERGLKKFVQAVIGESVYQNLFYNDDLQELPEEPKANISDHSHQVSTTRHTVKHNDAPCDECEDSHEAINGRFCKLLQKYVEYSAKNCPKKNGHC